HHDRRTCCPDIRGAGASRSLHYFATGLSDKLLRGLTKVTFGEFSLSITACAITAKADSCTAAQISKLSTIALAGGSKSSPESASIRLVMTAPPIIDGSWF